MATVHFYEKPGCISNARQKKLLSQAGHLLIIHDLLQQPWANAPEKLRSFFGEMPVSNWFNQSAPAIKHGDIQPENLSAEQAINLMVANPLLIRRPLLEADGKRQAGFDIEQISAWLGLAADDMPSGLESCSKPPTASEPQVCKP